MTASTRKERERAQRHQLIITTARELAEAEGWEAVTTRKLAQRIEYSQPVLYSHFANKGAIMDAVVVEGCGELAMVLRAAITPMPDPATALTAVAETYMDYSRRYPATFDAIFLRPTGLAFGPDAPQQLQDAFAPLFAVFAPLAGDRDPMVFTEVGWSAIHGLTILDRSGRLPAKDAERRLAVLVDQFLA